jgi:hypothetical protein
MNEFRGDSEDGTLRESLYPFRSARPGEEVTVCIGRRWADDPDNGRMDQQRWLRLMLTWASSDPVRVRSSLAPRVSG